MSRMKDEMEKMFTNIKEEAAKAGEKQKNIFKPVKPGDMIVFKYRNYKGEVDYRKAVVKGIFFGTTDYHPDFQGFLKAFDTIKMEERDFAIRDILYMEVYPI